MKILSSRREGAGEHEGIQVLRYELSLPQPVGDEKAQKRIRNYYERCLGRLEQFARSELTSLAGRQFELSMAQSRVFDPFSLRCSFLCHDREDTGCLIVSIRLTASYGRFGDFVQSFSDYWELTDGFPAPKKAAAFR